MNDIDGFEDDVLSEILSNYPDQDISDKVDDIKTLLLNGFNDVTEHMMAQIVANIKYYKEFQETTVDHLNETNDRISNMLESIRDNRLQTISNSTVVLNRINELCSDVQTIKDDTDEKINDINLRLSKIEEVLLRIADKLDIF